MLFCDDISIIVILWCYFYYCLPGEKLLQLEEPDGVKDVGGWLSRFRGRLGDMKIGGWLSRFRGRPGDSLVFGDNPLYKLGTP